VFCLILSAANFEAGLEGIAGMLRNTVVFALSYLLGSAFWTKQIFAKDYPPQILFNLRFRRRLF
jgi:hypothetical protein